MALYYKMQHTANLSFATVHENYLDDYRAKGYKLVSSVPSGGSVDDIERYKKAKENNTSIPPNSSSKTGGTATKIKKPSDVTVVTTLKPDEKIEQYIGLGIAFFILSSIISIFKR